jgi:multidrug efflux pump
MLLSDISIKRPVVAIVASLLLVVFGLYALLRLPVRETPNIDRPVVSISVFYPGGSAVIMESRIIKVIEDQINGIQGLKTIGSQARDGRGHITLEFVEGYDISTAANDVRDQVGRVLSRLPEGIDPPTIQKADADADPIMNLNLSGSLPPMELADYAILTLQPRLSSIEGVASINVIGARKKAMRVWLDRRALAARGLTVTDVDAALRRENVELGAGELESEERNISMRTIRTLQTAADFERLVVARGPNNYLIRLGELAKVELAPVDVHSIYRNNGVPGVGLGIIKQPGASTLDVSKAVNAEIEQINLTLPSDLRLIVNSDTSDFIAAAIGEVTVAVAVAAVLVLAVIYLFLGTLRAAIIPAVTVPISLIGTAIILWPAQFSINILTLLAMVLAIGLVVDDAIIMLENIHRRMKLGEPPLLAAVRGARQVGMAIVSTTLVLVAAFMPIALLEGPVGRLFKEFAVSVAVAVLVSMFISLTLTPVMCSKILSRDLDTGKVAHWADAVFENAKARYRALLDRALDAPMRVAAGFAIIVALCGVLFALLPQEFTPREDRGYLNMAVRTPEGSNAEYTGRQMQLAVAMVKPYIESGEVVRVMEFLAAPNYNQTQAVIVFAPWSTRKRSTFDVMRELQPKVREIAGAQVTITVPPSLGRTPTGGLSGGTQLAISGSTFDELRVYREAMLEGLVGHPLFARSRTNFNETKPQIHIRVDQARAGDLGVSVNDISKALEAMMGSSKVTTFIDKGEEYDVLLQAQDDDRRVPNDVSNIYVRSATTKELIPLSSVVTLEETSYAESLNRLDRRRTFNLNLFPKSDALLGDIVAEVERIAHERLPATAGLTWRGEAGDFKENSGAIYFSFAMALIVVFLVLAAQFESFIHPLVIMITVPLAVFGALAGLLIFGQSINLFSQIGIIVLVGLAAKNGILIVEFANQLRDAGHDFREALVDACLTRFRPIVMTALATTMGALPLVIATGAGAESRRPIGVVIFMGVSFAAVITLVVVPVFYMLLAKRTGSPGRVAAELREYEKHFPMGAHSTPDQAAGE